MADGILGMNFGGEGGNLLQGLLAGVGAGLASRGNRSQAIGQGLLGAVQGYDGAVQNSAFADYRSQQAAQQKMAMDAAQKKRDYLAQAYGGSSDGQPSPIPQVGSSLSIPVGPLPSASGGQPAPQAPAQAGPTWAGLLRAGYSPDEAKAILSRGGPQAKDFDLKDVTGDSYARYLQTNNPADLVTARKLESLNLGNQYVMADPITGKPVTSMAINTSPDALLSASTTRRGQDMADARDRDQLNRPTGQPFSATDANGRPILVQQLGDGSIRPISGYTPKADSSVSQPITVTDPSGKPVLVQQRPDGSLQRVEGYGPKANPSATNLTEQQSKDLLFGSRAQEADKVLNDLTMPFDGSSGVNLFAANALNSGGFAGTLRNIAAPASVQKYNQAKRDFLNAVLRKESGAAIAAQEFESGDQQYFPQPGDSKAVIQQKAQNRRLASQGILVGVPDWAKGTLTGGNQPAGGSRTPAIGTIKGGYRFRGGNPAQQSSWEKM